MRASIHYGEGSPGTVKVDARGLRTWVAGLLGRVGTPPDIAADVADVLLAADLRGIASHGTARLAQYLKLIEERVVDPSGRPTREGGREAISIFNANNGWGHHAARVAIDDAIARAAFTGVAVALVHNSTHYGIAGWYAMRAASRGFIGISLTNSSPLVAPTRARVAMIGTNPVAVAVPAGKHGMLVLDMATSTVPRGRLEVAARRGETLPFGWAIGPDGSPTTSPEAGLAGALLPLGGEEDTAGYKGYGLALIVDVLTGVLAGARFGPNILGLFSTAGKSDLGHLLMALDPAAVADPAEFVARLEQYLDQLAASALMPDAPGPVIYPGLPEAERAARHAREGIPIDPAHYDSLVELGRHWGLAAPEVHRRKRGEAGHH